VLDDELRSFASRLLYFDTSRSIYLHASVSVARACSRLRVGSIYTHLGIAGEMVIGVASRLARVPLVVHRHVSPRLSARPIVGAYQKRLYPSVLRSATGIISVSEAVHETVEQRGWAPSRHVMVPNAPPRVIPMGSQTREQFRESVRGDGPLVGLISRLDRTKGVEDFMEAATLVSARRAVRFVVVGDSYDPSYMQQLQDSARARQLGNLHFLGYRPDVGTVLSGLDVVVIPSHEEGRPLRLLEALDLEKALVATDIPGIREVVTHGESAYLVPPGAPAALAEGIDAVLDDPGLAKRLSTNGLRIVRRRFNPDTTYGRCADLVEAWSV
jgi:glycosyltransferase involved in cell wall biosynthesis